MPPLSRVYPVSLFSQADNASGQGWRECMSSCCAMIAHYYGRIGSDDAYNLRRRRFGDTVNPAAQVKTLESLGLVARFTTRADQALLLSELHAGRPLAVGWLHLGPVSAPEGGGHWSVVSGWSPSGCWHLDPNGEAALVRGGHVSNRRGWEGWYSWRNWLPRWDLRTVPAAGHPSRPAGWAILVTPRT